ncbi:MAG: histidine phosphatase family protein [Rhizobacter sp.]|nr:histidine phosphatase family protein [Rhizobacter sp.]
MSLVLIRHGETTLNAARVMQPADTPLSGRGLRQADALAMRVAQLGVAGIVASPLPRAWQTAEAIAAATGRPISRQALLEERNFGELRGLAYDALAPGALTSGDAPPGGESMLDFETRVAQAFAALLALRATLGGPLAVVTHGLVIRALIARHLALPRGTALPARIANTSITLAAAQPPHEVSLLDCTRHLTGDLRDDAASLSGG